MTTISRDSAVEETTTGAVAYGLAVFGGAMLVTIGFFQGLVGLAAVIEDEVYLTTQDYVYRFDLTGWGWFHIALAVLAVVVGLALIMRLRWSMYVGIVVAVVSAVSNFMFLPYYPLWSLVIIAFDVAIVWALAVQLRRT